MAGASTKAVGNIQKQLEQMVSDSQSTMSLCTFHRLAARKNDRMYASFYNVQCVKHCGHKVDKNTTYLHYFLAI